MLIVNSKYKDYYDSVAYSKGIDKSIVYNRELQEIKLNWLKNFPSHDITWINSGNKTSVSTFIFGFCGKLYSLCVKKTKETNKIEIIYDLDSIINLDEFKNNNFYRKNEFEYYTQMLNSKKVSELFFEFKTPSFLIGAQQYHNKFNLIINPNLKDLEFYRIMDAYTTFQEIEMFISGVIGTETKKVIEITDKDKIIGKGFDYKTSFRNIK